MTGLQVFGGGVSQAAVDASVATHVAAPDPHADRAYADTKSSATPDNLIFDPYNQYRSPASPSWTNLAGVSRANYFNNAHLTAVADDQNNPFGCPTLRMGTGITIAGKTIFIADVNLAVGAVVSLGMMVRMAAGTGRIYATCYSAGSSTLLTSSGTTTTFVGNTQILTVANITIPANTSFIVISFNRLSGSDVADIYYMWMYRGSSAGRIGAPLPISRAYTEAKASLNRHLLRDWRAQLGKILGADGTGQAVVAFLGDSWTSQGAITGPLATWLQATYGDAGAGYCTCLAGTNEPTGVTRGITGTWTEDAGTGAGQGVDLTHVVSSDIATPAAYTFAASVHGMTIHYVKKTGGGTFRYQIDAGGWTAVDTANAGDLFATAVISGLDGNAHTLTIEVTGAGTTGVTLLGVDCTKTGNGVRVAKIGNSGATSYRWTQNNATIWQAGLTAIAPNLCIVLLGVNDDAADGVTPANQKIYLSTLIDRIRAAMPLCDILIACPPKIGLGPGTYDMGDYAVVQRDLAWERGCAFIDGVSHFGEYADSNSRGLWTNTSHMNAYGCMQYTNLLIERMLKVR